MCFRRWLGVRGLYATPDLLGHVWYAGLGINVRAFEYVPPMKHIWTGMVSVEVSDASRICVPPCGRFSRSLSEEFHCARKLRVC